MIHFTHTGAYAGRPFCDTIKHSNPDDKFLHPGYGILTTENIHKGIITLEGKDMYICPKCQKFWLED